MLAPHSFPFCSYDSFSFSGPFTSFSQMNTVCEQKKRPEEDYELHSPSRVLAADRFS